MEIRATFEAVAKNTELLKKLLIQMDNDLPIDTVIEKSISPSKANKLIEDWRQFKPMDYDGFRVNSPEGHPYHYRKSDKPVDWQYCMEKYAQILGAEGVLVVSFNSIDAPEYYVVMTTTEKGSSVIIDANAPGEYTDLKEALKSEYSNPELVKAALAKANGTVCSWKVENGFVVHA